MNQYKMVVFVSEWAYSSIFLFVYLFFTTASSAWRSIGLLGGGRELSIFFHKRLRDAAGGGVHPDKLGCLYSQQRSSRAGPGPDRTAVPIVRAFNRRHVAWAANYNRALCATRR